MDRLRHHRALAALLLACALVAVSLAHRPHAGQAAPAAADQVLVVGDSLAVGMRPHLDGLLGGRPTAWSVRSGITTPQGMQRLRRQLRRASRRRTALSPL